MNELFFLLFVSFFVLNCIFTIDLFTSIFPYYNMHVDIVIMGFFFAVPKKRNKTSRPLKKKIFNKSFNMRRLNGKSIHFDEFFNNLPKWEE